MRSTNVMMKNNEFKHETSVKKYKFFENNQNKLEDRCIYQRTIDTLSSEIILIRRAFEHNQGTDFLSN